MTLIRFEVDSYHEYDLREPVSKIVFPDQQYIHNTPTNNLGYPEQKPNVVSSNYTRVTSMKPKPRATKSVNIDLGGVRR